MKMRQCVESVEMCGMMWNPRKGMWNYSTLLNLLWQPDEGLQFNIV